MCLEYETDVAVSIDFGTTVTRVTKSFFRVATETHAGMLAVLTEYEVRGMRASESLLAWIKQTLLCASEHWHSALHK